MHRRTSFPAKAAKIRLLTALWLEWTGI